MASADLALLLKQYVASFESLSSELYETLANSDVTRFNTIHRTI